MQEDFPGVKVATYAYQYTRSAPTKVKPSEHVIVNFATMGTCFGHLKEAECEGVNGTATYVDGTNNPWTKDMKDWGAICNEEQLWIRDYSTDVGYPLTTMPDFGNFRENMQYYVENGSGGNEHECGLASGNLGEFSELCAYLLSKVLWNPYMSEEEYNGYMDAFIAAVYGEAGPYIKEYIKLAQDVSKDLHSELVAVPTDRYETPVVTNHTADELPEELTVEMIKNYKDTDWTKYWNWYADVQEHQITEEGEKIFEKALAAEGTEIQKKKTKQASLQVNYIKSFYLYNKILYGGKVRNLVSKFMELHPDEFTQEEKNTLPVTIGSYAREQVNAQYYDYNYEFCSEMIDAGLTAMRHSLTGWEKFDFTQAPSSWN